MLFRSPLEIQYVVIHGTLWDISELILVSPTLRLRHNTHQHRGGTFKILNNWDLTSIRTSRDLRPPAVPDIDKSFCESRKWPGGLGNCQSKRGDTIYQLAWNYLYILKMETTGYPRPKESSRILPNSMYKN